MVGFCCTVSSLVEPDFWREVKQFRVKSLGLACTLQQHLGAKILNQFICDLLLAL